MKKAFLLLAEYLASILALALLSGGCTRFKDPGTPAEPVPEDDRDNSDYEGLTSGADFSQGGYVLPCSRRLDAASV